MTEQQLVHQFDLADDYGGKILYVPLGVSSAYALDLPPTTTPPYRMIDDRPNVVGEVDTDRRPTPPPTPHRDRDTYGLAEVEDDHAVILQESAEERQDRETPAGD